MPERETKTLTVLTAEGVSVEALRTILEDERLRWAYASRMEDTGLGWIRDLLAGEALGAVSDDRRPGVPLARWEEGRAFGPDLEVDWWREEDAYRLRALLEDGDGPKAKGVSWSEASEEQLIAKGERYVVLHGTRDESSGNPPSWSEARVPRPLAHPYEPEADEALPERIAMRCEDYARNSIVTLTRLIAVVPVDEEGGNRDA